MLNPSALSIGTIALLVRILTIVQLDLAFSSPADTLELSRAETWENPFFFYPRGHWHERSIILHVGFK